MQRRKPTTKRIAEFEKTIERQSKMLEQWPQALAAEQARHAREVSAMHRRTMAGISLAKAIDEFMKAYG